ncbi:MAG: sortase domain-containing protein [Candidatus Limnocylindria bacterium]
MKRLLAWAVPAVLGVVGVTLIILGTRGEDGGPTTSLPPIVEPSTSAVAQVSPGEAPSTATSATPQPTQTPVPAGTIAVQLEVPSVGVNVLIQQSVDDATDNFPPRDAAYILQGSAQPGQNANSYIFAHATEALFKPLWNVQVGAAVLIRMSDDSVRQYIVTEVRPNVPCPDPNADPAMNPPDPPLTLQLHETCEEGLFWLQPTDHERITLQTSQGFNRNWGEFVVVADPAG